MELLNEEQLKEVVKSSFVKIKDDITGEIIKELSNSLRWQLQENYKEVITKFFKEEIEPELAVHLINNKEVFLKEMVTIANDVSKEFGKKISEKLVDAFSTNSYKTKRILDELF